MINISIRLITILALIPGTTYGYHWPVSDNWETYEDNTFAIKIMSLDTERYVYNKDPNKVFVYKYGEHDYINLKDINKLTIGEYGKHTFIDKENNTFHGSKPAEILLCDTAKNCKKAAYQEKTDDKFIGSYKLPFNALEESQLDLSIRSYKSELEDTQISYVYVFPYYEQSISGKGYKFQALSDQEKLALFSKIEQTRPYYYKKTDLEKSYWDSEIKNIRAKHAKIEADAKSMRKSVKPGTETNCGYVIEVNKAMVLVQTKHGSQHIPLGKLYPPNIGCKFDGQLYIGPDI